MRLIAAAAVSVVLVLSACGGGADDATDPATDGSGSGEAEGGAPETATPADLGQVGGQLEGAWGVECGEELVDMAGYTKRVCGIPDDLMSPGMGSNAVGLHAWSERSQVEEYRDAYLGEGVLIVGDGWFADAPDERVAAAVEDALSG